MFCPKCRGEYREGFNKCEDCGVELVNELPPEPTLEFVDYVEVLATFNPGDIALIKSILDSTDIKYFFQGENFAHVRPLVDPARLMVRKDQVQDAVSLLSDLKLSLTGINFPRQ